MASGKADSIVSAYLEHVSGALLERYPKVIRELIQGRSGIYALYKGEKIYYIGFRSYTFTVWCLESTWHYGRYLWSATIVDHWHLWSQLTMNPL